MWKKLGIVVAVLLVAVAGFLFYLNNQLENNIINFAQQQGFEISADNLNITWLDRTVEIKNANYKIGNIEFSNISAELANIKLETSPNTAVSAMVNHIRFSFNQRPYTLSFEKIKLLQLSKSHYQIDAQNAQINQSKLTALSGDLTNSYFTFQLTDHKTNLNGTLQITQQNQHTQISGVQIPTSLVHAILSMPTLVEGISQFEAEIQRQSSSYSGTFHIQTKDGTINNLNLLDIAAQRLPINYQKDQLEQKNINTQFDLMESEFKFTDQFISVKRSTITTKDIMAYGEGDMLLGEMKCNFILNISARDPKYQKIVLPVRFYGDCLAPKYKIEFNKGFRDNLKEMLKERLK